MFFYAIRCLNCGCVHGWVDHPQVKKVEKHHRGSMEDIWWCPQCDRQHRTHDGSWFGQMQKLWEEIRSEQDIEPEEVVEMDMMGRTYVRRGKFIVRGPREEI